MRKLTLNTTRDSGPSDSFRWVLQTREQTINLSGTLSTAYMTSSNDASVCSYLLCFVYSLQETYEAKRSEHIREMQTKEEKMRQMFVQKVCPAF